jgi:hypothetical protein
MIGKGKASDTALPAAVKVSTSTPPGLENQLQGNNTSQENGLNIRIRIGTDEPLETPSQMPRFPHAHHSQYVKEHSYPRSYLNANTPPLASIQNTYTKVKASDLPKFKGDKGEDVETWIEQLSAIFQANRCSDSEIVAFLSVILKRHRFEVVHSTGSQRAFTVCNLGGLTRCSSPTIPESQLPRGKEKAMEEERSSIQRGHSRLLRRQGRLTSLCFRCLRS